jgi:quinol monooxygenase YgiN
MAFVQTISFKTSRIDEMQKLLDEFSQQQGEAQVPGFRGTKLLKDRDNEDAFLVLADFVSYALAMENSGRPETDAFAKRMAEMSDGPPTFGNYDLIQVDAP